MTENKRFHFGYVLGDTGLIDEQSTEHKWFIENCCSVSDLKKNWKIVCDKLNEVADDNEQLKSELGILKGKSKEKEHHTKSNMRNGKRSCKND